MSLDGVVRDVKGLFQSREALWDDYVSALQAVDFGINLLSELVRSKRVAPQDAKRLARSLSSDITHLIGEHPLRYRTWRIVKEDARELKNELRDTLNMTLSDTWELNDRLRMLHPDEKTYLYEHVPEPRPELTIAEPAYLHTRAQTSGRFGRALQKPSAPKPWSDEAWYQSETYKESTREGAKCLMIGMFAGYCTLGAAVLGHYLHNKGVNVIALYSAVPGTALLGYAMNMYQERQRSRPEPEHVAPVEPQPAPAAPVAKSAPGTLNTRIGATMISLCALMSMMGGNASAYDREAAKPHKARQLAEYAQLVFPDEFPR